MGAETLAVSSGGAETDGIDLLPSGEDRSELNFRGDLFILYPILSCELTCRRLTRFSK